MPDASTQQTNHRCRQDENCYDKNRIVIFTNTDPNPFAVMIKLKDTPIADGAMNCPSRSKYFTLRAKF